MPDGPNEACSSRDHGSRADAPVPETQGQAAIWRAGRTSWAWLGITLLVAVVLWLVSLVPLVVIPFVLALFPATLLKPVADWLMRVGLPAALASITTILAGIALIVGVLGSMIALIVAEAPDLIESAGEGIEQVEGFLEEVGAPGLSGLIEQAGEQMGEVGDYAGEAIGAAVVAFESIAGLIIMVVILFFFLKDAGSLTEGVLGVVPARFRDRARGVAYRAWDTLGKYFRGQLLVALVDAIVIGIGLLVLGVPLAVPLAVLIFFGGLFPIVGAVTTGALAVLVALADGGLTSGLIVLGLVLAVQQLESNVLEPIILGKAIHLHPLVVLLSITAGAVTLGILGAFLAVPIAAVIARSIEYLRGEEEDDDNGPTSRKPGNEAGLPTLRPELLRLRCAPAPGAAP